MSHACSLAKDRNQVRAQALNVGFTWLKSGREGSPAGSSESRLSEFEEVVANGTSCPSRVTLDR